MITRYITAITSGSFVTLTLFYVMQSLIAMGSIDIAETEKTGHFEFIRLIEEETLHIDEPLLVLPPVPDITDPKPPVETVENTATATGVRLERPTEPRTGALTGFGTFLNDGPLVALYRVEPTYPGQATLRNLEGWVIVEFDVNPDGSVSNVRVINSSHRLFENSAVHAAERFRYKARVLDGVAQTSRGIQSKFTFRMEQG